MGIWDVVESEETQPINMEEPDENPYLIHTEKSIKLISDLLKSPSKNREQYKQKKRFHYLINRDFSNFTKNLDNGSELLIYQRLISIKKKLDEFRHMKEIEGKHIIALGGGFSAGKSKFINSLMDSPILPEDQTPTTSIPSYILKNSNEDLYALTYQGNKVSLDHEAVDALSHAFYNHYHLSFTNIIKNIMIQTPNHKFDHIALLDTPGYTKSESHKHEDQTDEYTAKTHLRVADYLIWVTNIENGTILDGDLEFISNMGYEKPILFVFNQADKKPQQEIESIVTTSKKELEKRGFNVFGVTAYSSLEVKEYTGNVIQDFLCHVNQMKKRDFEVEQELEQIFQHYDQYFSISENEYNHKMKSLGESITHSNDLGEMIDMVYLYSKTSAGKRNLNNKKKEWGKLKGKIEEVVTTYTS